MLTTEQMKELESSKGRFGIITLKYKRGFNEDPFIDEPMTHRVFILEIQERTVIFFSLEKGWYMSASKSEIESFEIDNDYRDPKATYTMRLLTNIYEGYKSDQIHTNDYMFGTQVVNDAMDIINEKSINYIATGPFYNSFVGDYKHGRKGAFMIGNSVNYKAFEANSDYPFVSKHMSRYIVTDTQAALEFLDVANDSRIQNVLKNIEVINKQIFPVCEPHVKPLTIDMSVSVVGESWFGVTINVYYTYLKEFASLGAIKRPLEKVRKELEKINAIFEMDHLPF